MTTKRESSASFGESYRKLEETVEKLERGGLPLEESIALYEEGMELAKHCQGILDKAELRITKLRESFTKGSPNVDDNGAVEEEAFPVENE